MPQVICNNCKKDIWKMKLKGVFVVKNKYFCNKCYIDLEEV